ncbi:histidine phosphatase family protein [Rhodobacterales bacterium HKCCE3408]|nr:histidine phosphatase family protein [Rhodobacterales bacterium HKCCE3408]
MGEIVLVRHGQANSAATDEASYDRLSELGFRQAEWLGAWMRDHEAPFDHVLSGTLRRHRETVQAMGFEADEDARLNEIDYYTLSQQLLERHGVPLPGGPDDFADHMPRIFAAWHAAEIEGAEPYERFESRVAEMLEEAAVPGRRLLCVTSGGVIGMVLRHLLDLDLMRLAVVMLPIQNTSIHRIRVRGGRVFLSGFNATPHLDPPDRAGARTFY